MDQLDRMLLDLMQQAFPMTATPWQQLGQQLGLTEEETLERVRRLKELGVIRRIGGVLDAAALHFVSCLCAMRVPEERVAEVAQEINRCPGVTHNYQRKGTYNLWFTLTTSSEEARRRQLRAWEYLFGLPILCFPGEKTYKRRVQFRMQQAGEKS